MDATYNEIMEKIERKRTTHPNLIKYWEQFLLIKKNNFIKSLENCDVALENTALIKDFTKEELLSLTLMKLTSAVKINF